MATRLLVPLLALALAAPAAASAGPQQRIVNGSPTATADLPYVAGLQIAIEGDGDHRPDALCGGSLIAARWVLTAAHCIAEDPVDVPNSFAVLGATNLNAAADSQRYRWAQAIPAPAYAKGTGGSDVGLVRLARPAGTPQVRLLQPGDRELFAPGTPALTAGWGFTEDREDGGALSTTQLRSVVLDIVSDPDCAQAFAAAGQPAGALEFETEICAIAPNRDSCNGDSGGPLVVQDAGGLPGLVGAVSFGIGSGNVLRGDRSCNEGPPGVYAKLATDPLNDFIRRHVPQVELELRPAAPVAGEEVTLTAVPRAPGGDGRFGGYDGLSWDLDGDGRFGERAGRRIVTTRVRRPLSSVAVLATTAGGDAEVRRLNVVPRAKSAVSFARRSARVRAGRAVRVRVVRLGEGAGTATLRVWGRGVTPRVRRLRFTGDEAARTVWVRTRPGGSRTVRLRLRSFTGDVIAGQRTRAELQVEHR